MTGRRGFRLHLRAHAVPAVTAALLAVVPALSWVGAHLPESRATTDPAAHGTGLIASAVAAAVAVRVIFVADPTLESSTARSGPRWRTHQTLAVLLAAPLLVAATAAATGHSDGGLAVRDTVGCTALAVIAARCGLGALAGLPGAAYLAVVSLTAAAHPRPTPAAAAATWPVQPPADTLPIVLVLVLAAAAVLSSAARQRPPHA